MLLPLTSTAACTVIDVTVARAVATAAMPGCIDRLHDRQYLIPIPIAAEGKDPVGGQRRLDVAEVEHPLDHQPEVLLVLVPVATLVRPHGVVGTGVHPCVPKSLLERHNLAAEVVTKDHGAG